MSSSSSSSSSSLDGKSPNPSSEATVGEDEIKRLVQEEAMRLPDLNIAVSGIAGRFPKADSINEFEENLYTGEDMINDQDNSRFTCGLWNLPPRAGRLKDLSKFDNEFFGFTPEEANCMDYQLRILYEVVYESILDAGVNPASLRGSNTGVFFGLHCNEFENAMADDPAYKTSGYYAQFGVKVAQYFDFRGITLTFDAACASAFVGLHNAVQALKEGLIDQAIVCSSNIPIHPTGSFIFLQMQMLSPTGYSRFLDSRADGYVKSEACVSVLLQRKHLALRNYASVMATMTSVDGYKPEGITFPSDKSQEELIRRTKELAGVSTNHIEYLEAHGTGTPAGDPQEVSAISNVYFPARKSGQRVAEKAPPQPSATELTSSSGDGEAEEVAHKMSESGRGEETIEDEEGEGNEENEKRCIGPLLVGSVKTNMGHSEAASGLCALSKVVLMLENELIYRGLHYEHPNSNIEALMEGRLKFVDQTTKLRGKIIPLSCYGFGGSNVHAIVRANERPTIGNTGSANNHANNNKNSSSSIEPRLIVMFGRSEEALNEFFDSLLNTKSRHTRHCLSDDFLALIDSINSGKIDRMMDFRGYLVVDRPSVDQGLDKPTELVRSIVSCKLKSAKDIEKNVEDIGRRIHVQESSAKGCNLLLPGLGAEWPAMAAGLVEYQPFWSTIERLAIILEPFQEHVNLEHVLTSSNKQAFESLSLTELFVAIVAYQMALINMVRDQLKVDCKTIVGHSLGEVSCAYAVGLFNEREAIMVAYHMGRTLDSNKQLIAGQMVVVGLNECEAKDYIRASGLEAAGCLEISCINGLKSVTISGRQAEMDLFCSQLSQQNIFTKQVHSSVALHNQTIMDGQVKRLLRGALMKVLFPGAEYKRTNTGWLSSVSTRAVAATVTLNQSQYDSNGSLSNHWLNNANANYFAECLCRKVDFLNCLQKLDGDSVVLELGPCGLFESQVRQLEASLDSTQYMKMMRAFTPINRQKLYLIEAMGQLYQSGICMNLLHFYTHNNNNNATNPIEMKFPVRRQTPSLSSLFRWNHQLSHFVPRYPIQFSKSSAKCEIPVDIVQDRDKYMSGHCIEGRILYPATGYLFLIWRVFSFTKRKVYDACFHDVEHELVPIEFHNVRLLRAVILGSRLVQIYIHFEEGTGRFEIKEGGSVVVEGYARTPIEKPKELLYENTKEKILNEDLKLELDADAVYKQFRVSGYDYGETFRNIEASSSDGRYCRVKYNGHFVALTDSILQSIFLAITQYAPSGGLFLPTRFEYVRFQPEIILNKIRQAKMVFDLGDGSLNTKLKRDIMTKMMQREGNSAAQVSEAARQESELDKANEEAIEAAKEEEKCIFETFCDPVTGVIITDGIEMRGIKASPAPRRSDNNEVLLESQQFVADDEELIDDESLTKFNQLSRNYVQVCNSMSIQLLAKVLGKSGEADNSSPLELLKLASKKGDEQVTNVCVDHTKFEFEQLEEIQIETYKSHHLKCYHGNKILENSSGARSSQEDEKDEEDREQEYDIRKNGDKMLMSVLDQLLHLAQQQQSKTIDNKTISPKQVRELVQTNRIHLMRDLIQGSLISERFVRPLIETIIENSCMKKSKLRMLEVNLDDSLMKDPLQSLIIRIEPTLALDYSLAHPDLSRLSASNKTASANCRTYTLKQDLQSLFEDPQLKQLDLIVYKDISCYSLPKQIIEGNGLTPIMSSLNGAVRSGGFVMIVMRKRLTLAERVLLSLSEPELVGLSQKDYELASGDDKAVAEQARASAEKIERINHILAARCRLMLSEAERNKMLLVARKGDSNGCTILLFKTTKSHDLCEQQQQQEQQTTGGFNQELSSENRLLVRVTHETTTQLANGEKSLKWLEEMKKQFARPEKDQKEELNSSIVLNTQEQEESSAEGSQKIVWLCAVTTRQQPISGLVGMMRALGKELGTSRLRCFLDQYTFKDRNEPVSLAEIEASENFLLALKRNLIWNCIDSLGRFGSYRHFTINNFVSHEEALCSNNNTIERDSGSSKQLSASENCACQPTIKGAYVNNATRGDLSSFAWFEAPLKHLSLKEKESLVRVAYSALNFRDIMLATGRLPLDAIPIRLAMSDCLLGLEFSGFDARGRRCMGMVFGRGLATHVLCPEEGAIRIEIPAWLGLREAATIPVVYATAIMALIYRGRMKCGESILIHAGSGGVGQAAIRLAAHFGLTIFTSVGSEEKRKFLLDEFDYCLEEERIFSSRDCHFEEQIMRATKGRGVDLVLNSLADDKLQASVRCLADGGRFLEIGKYDMSTDARLELLRLDTNKTFHGILLDKLFDTDDMGPAFKSQLRCVLATLRDGLELGYVKPIRFTMFKRNQIEEAFRFMATGKHIGKILIEIDAASESPKVMRPADGIRTLRCVPRFQVSPRKSYIVTGALGGFGLELVKWLVHQGARYLVLTSRTGIRTGYQKATLERLKSNSGAKFLIVNTDMADASSKEGAERLCELALNLSPVKQLGGLFHLAMLLKDTLLENMSAQDFEMVYKPKAEACFHLDAATRLLTQPIDYFVAFSSVTSGKGNAGQSNYAYANSCLERICELRRQAGLHGLAIQWGAIGDVGVAFDNLGGNDVIIGGTIPQRMPSCLTTLAKLLCTPFATCLAVVPAKRASDGSGERGDLVGAIMHVLGIKDPSKVNDLATLGELGLDSLMAVEIRQYIEREYDMTLNIQEIRSLTIARIREISETEKAGDKSGSRRSKLEAGSTGQGGAGRRGVDSEPKTMREVQSYGSGGSSLSSSVITANGASFVADTGPTMEASRLGSAANEAIEAMLDKRMVASFVPQLELPKADFVRLNWKHVAHACSKRAHQTNEQLSPDGTANGTNALDQYRPIFFIPPIHGEFDRLEAVCAHIKRPCIGINWTRRQGRATNMSEAVDIYLELLQRADWPRQFNLPTGATLTGKQADDSDLETSEQRVDLVGYSFGATVAFELMLAIHKLHQKRLRRREIRKNGHLEPAADERVIQLRPGHLVLLDGSPKQIELGSQYLTNLTRKKPLKLSEKVDELLMLYIVAHTRNKNVNYLELQRGLAEADLEDKVEVASYHLANILGLSGRRDSTQRSSGQLNGNTKSVDKKAEEEEDDDETPNKRVEIAHAMEAFVRRYDLINGYKLRDSLPADCTLIRAEQLYLSSAQQESQYNEDLGLASAVEGKINLFVMKGDHETFLNANHRNISEVIMKHCSTTSDATNTESGEQNNGNKTVTNGVEVAPKPFTLDHN